MGFVLPPIASRLATYGTLTRAGKALCVLLLLGLLLPGLPARAGQVTILAFGDSLTQGYGLPPDEGFVPRLQAWLQEHGHGDVRLINGGVSGDTTAGGASRIGWSLGDDVDAMILALGGNDMLRGIDPAVTRENLARIIETARARGVAVLLVGIAATGNFGPAYKRAFDAIFGELARRYGTLYYANFLEGLGSDDPQKLRPLLQPDGIHPNARGVRRIVAAIGPAVVALIERVRQEPRQ